MLQACDTARLLWIFWQCVRGKITCFQTAVDHGNWSHRRVWTTVHYFHYRNSQPDGIPFLPLGGVWGETWLITLVIEAHSNTSKRWHPMCPNSLGLFVRLRLYIEGLPGSYSMALGPPGLPTAWEGLTFQWEARHNSQAWPLAHLMLGIPQEATGPKFSFWVSFLSSC